MRRDRTGVLLRCLFADTDLDLDRFFYLSRSSSINFLGVRFSFSSLSAKHVREEPSDSRGWENASSQDILSYSLFFKHLLIKSFDIYEMLGSKTTLFWLMFAKSCISLLAGQGV